MFYTMKGSIVLALVVRSFFFVVLFEDHVGDTMHMARLWDTSLDKVAGQLQNHLLF